MMSKLCMLILAFFLLATAAEGQILTLRDTLQKAASANHELKVAAYDIKIAEQNITIGRSGYLPRVDVDGGYTAQKDPQAFKFGTLVAPTQDPRFGFFSAALHQTLYDFGRTSARYERAKALTEAASYDYSARQKDVFLQVVEAYYGILENRKLLLSAEEEVAQMTDHLKVAQNLFEQGVVTRNDLLQAEVQLANSRQRRLAGENRVQNSWLNLNYLTGQPSGFRADLQEGDGLEAIPTRLDMDTVTANRPEIKALKKGIEAAQFGVKEARTGYFPEIFTRLGVDYVENSKVEEQAIMYATAGLSINIFDGFATTARYRQAVQSLSRDQESLRQLKSQIRLEYETAYNDARVAAERIATVRTSIQQGEENLRINRDRYQEQVGTATNVIDAQTLLTQTKTDYYRAIFDYEVAVARVKKAMGDL